MADKTDSPKSTTPARKPKPVRLNLKPGITATAGQDIESPSSILAPQLKEIHIPKSLQLDLKPEDISTLVELGSGAGGTIIHVEAKNSVRKQILRELQFLHKCNSPYIVSFYGAFLFEGDISICMEFMNCGSLDQVYKKTGNVPEDVAGKIGYATLAGLAYVYDEHRIIHRGEVKIGDFGVSGQTINSVANTFPERIQGESYTSASDVWSLGMTLVELVIGKFPFPPNGQPLSVFELLEYIVHEPVPTLPPGEFSPEFEKFVARSLIKDQTKRPAPGELLKDPYCVAIAAKDVDMISFVKVLYKE
ncbi:MAP kinase kinase (MEK) [Terramyces sp. JEL0728]|nr:MAP kinase kinase (MEK) [Terramyces sp. JEL0728]